MVKKIVNQSKKGIETKNHSIPAGTSLLIHPKQLLYLMTYFVVCASGFLPNT